MEGASWDSIPCELQCFQVNKRWHAQTTEDLLWHQFFVREFGEKFEQTIDQRHNTKEVGFWMQQFRHFSEVPRWDRNCSDKCFVFSNDDRKVVRHDPASFPKAISSLPINIARNQTIRVLLPYMFTIGLFHAETKEELHKFLNETGLGSSTENLINHNPEKTCCFFYMNQRNIVSRSNPQDTVNSQRFNRDLSWRVITQGVCELRIDSAANKVSFSFHNVSVGQATLPAPPVFLFYSNDGSGHAEILLGNETVDEDNTRGKKNDWEEK